MDSIISSDALIGCGLRLGRGVVIHKGVEIGDNVEIGDYTTIYSGTKIGAGTRIQPNCHLGVSSEGNSELKIGTDSCIRAGSIIYSEVQIGARLQTGHYTLIREKSLLGDDVLIGSYSVLDGVVVLGNNVKVQTGVYLTRFVTVEDNVFLGPYVKTTNDKYMQYGNKLMGNRIGKNCRLGCATILLPGVTLGEGVITGSGAVVAKDVAANLVVVGNPAKVIKSVEEMERGADFDSHC